MSCWPNSISLIDGKRHRRVVELLGIVWLLSLADLFFTLWAHRFTPFYELNPIARAMLQTGAFGTLICYKLSLTAAGTGLFWRTRRHGRSEIALWAIVGVYVALAFQWSDYTHGAVMMAMR
jgi:Domain of unknown function (DUF5658)